DAGAIARAFNIAAVAIEPQRERERLRTVPALIVELEGHQEAGDRVRRIVLVREPEMMVMQRDDRGKRVRQQASPRALGTVRGMRTGSLAGHKAECERRHTCSQENGTSGKPHTELLLAPSGTGWRNPAPQHPR